jgi:hypothetical protein
MYANKMKDQTVNPLESAAIVFDASLVKQLESPQVRIPANFVGVRRIRPHKLLEEKKKNTNNREATDVVFTVKDEHGNERRMNNQEKKALKNKLRIQKKEDRKRKRELQQEYSVNENESTSLATTTNLGDSNSRYYQLAINNAVLEQELAELRGERSGLPPVLLSPAMTLQAQGVLPGTTNGNIDQTCGLVYDHNLSIQWAQLIKASMQPAETARANEQLRPMPYQLTPEPWTRLRPNVEERRVETTMRPTHFEPKSSSNNNNNNSDLHSPPPKKCQWANMSCRPPTSFDSDVSIIFEYLHKDANYYVSCGAKFGSDFLVYDGPRNERHAFAGLRVLQAKDGELPIPSAYSLSGYVRCLNTAGKFALLATVVKDTDKEKPVYRVAFVDMALEKVLTAPTHKKRSRTQKRKDLTQNLAKK